MNGMDCGKGCRLGTEALIAQTDRNISILKGKLHFVGAEIALRTDQDAHRPTGLHFAGEKQSLLIAHAMRNEFLPIEGLGEEGADIRHLTQFGQRGLEALLHGRNGDTAHPFELQFLTLGVTTLQRNEGIQSHLDGFLQ